MLIHRSTSIAGFKKFGFCCLILIDKYSYKSFVEVRCAELKNMRWKKTKLFSYVNYWIFPVCEEENRICVLPWKETPNILRFPGFLGFSWNYCKHWGVLLFQLRRMQEMIAQMQAQMRMKPGDDWGAQPLDASGIAFLTCFQLLHQILAMIIVNFALWACIYCT